MVFEVNFFNLEDDLQEEDGAKLSRHQYIRPSVGGRHRLDQVWMFEAGKRMGRIHFIIQFDVLNKAQSVGYYVRQIIKDTRDTVSATRW